jgi:surfactin synthase thioesterase subunit
MSAGVRAANRWLRQYGPPGAGELRLLCFPYAGGSAAMFRSWHETLPAAVEPVAVQLPGRDSRLAEPPYEDMTSLVARLADVLAPVLDQPFACYGHSMGARVALEFAHELRVRGLPGPRALFVGSSVAPALRLPVRGWNEPDDRLVEYLRELGGTADLVFADRELLQLFLPTLRADLTVIGTHVPPARAPLAVPLYAFAGAADEQATAERMRPWRAETSAEFALFEVSGGHFFDAGGIRQLLQSIPELLGLP